MLLLKDLLKEVMKEGRRKASGVEEWREANEGECSVVGKGEGM